MRNPTHRGLLDCPILLLVDLNNPTNYHISMIKITDFAYAAGYIDGDGCFHLRKQSIKGRKSHKFMSRLIISSTNIEAIQWFKRTFGGSIRTRSNVTQGHKHQHHFIFHGKDIEIINQISQFLVEKFDESLIFNEFQLSDNRENLIGKMNELKFQSNLIPFSMKQEFEAVRNTIIPTEEDFAYLAGFIDAECCLNIQRSLPKNRPNPTYKILLQCNNTKFPCFKWLLQRFGGQLHFIDRSHFLPPCRNQMTWRLSCASLAKILDKIHPYIKHKKPVCEELIKFYKTTVPLTGMISRNHPKFGEFYKPILEEREQIFHKIQSLNKKGFNLSG